MASPRQFTPTQLEQLREEATALLSAAAVLESHGQRLETAMGESAGSLASFLSSSKRGMPFKAVHKAHAQTLAALARLKIELELANVPLGEQHQRKCEDLLREIVRFC